MVTDLAIANELIEKQQIHLQEQQVHIEELTRKLRSTQQQLKALQHQVEQLLRRVYGHSSEKFDPNQLRMFKDSELIEATEGGGGGAEPIGEIGQSSAVVEKKKPLKARRKHPGRIPIPEHLERVEIILDIPEDKKVCPETGKPLKQIGWEISEKLEYRPGRLFVNVYKRPKYVSPEVKVSDIAQIYKVESACKDMSPQDRYAYRNTHARPIIDRLFRRLEELIHETTPSEPLRKAINYALNQSEALYRYLDDGWLKPLIPWARRPQRLAKNQLPIPFTIP